VHPSSYTSRYLISSYLDTLCYGHDTTLTCINLVSTTENSAGPLLELVTSFTVLEPSIAGSQRAEGVAWRDPYGSVSYIDFTTRVITQWTNVRTPNFKATDFGYLAGISYAQNTTTFIGNTIFPFLNTRGVTDFSIGRAVLNNSYTCILTAAGASCSFVPCNPATRNCPLYSAYGPQESFTTLTAGANLPVLSLLNGMYTNSANTVTYLGLKTCLDNSGNLRPESFATQSSCSMYIPRNVYTIPTLPTVSQISLDSWGACVVTGGSLSCWSHVTYTTNPWAAYQSVTWVDVNDTGACVQYIDSNFTQKIKCWGTYYSLTSFNPSPPPQFITISNLVSLLPNLQQTVSGPETYATIRQPRFRCPKTTDVIADNLCIPCSFGSYLTPNPNGYSSCSVCPSTTPVRGIGDSACRACTLGTQPSPDFSSCISCTSNSINSISTFSQCKECPPGFQASTTRQVCLPCVDIPYATRDFLVREKGAEKCHFCEFPLFPFRRDEPCASCPQPSVPLFRRQNIFSDANGSWTCNPCPVGFDANNLGSCTQCSLSFARNTSQTQCTQCPEGFQSSADFSSCTQCTGNTFRKLALACAECPKGTFVNADFTSCGEKSKLSVSALSSQQTAFVAAGIGIIIIVFASSSKLNRAQIITGIFLGLAVATSGYFLS